jgi:hypothetical protein
LASATDTSASETGAPEPSASDDSVSDDSSPENGASENGASDAVPGGFPPYDPMVDPHDQLRIRADVLRVCYIFYSRVYRSQRQVIYGFAGRERWAAI